MSTKYTPAPWLVEGTTVYALEHYGWKKGEEQFCNRFTISVQRGQSNADDELEANARLIATAPELLEALQEALPYFENIDDRGPRDYGWQSEELLALIVKAKDVIAKALGEQA